MVATERVVVLMSPAEKAALVAKAVLSGRISAGELIGGPCKPTMKQPRSRRRSYGAC